MAKPQPETLVRFRINVGGIQVWHKGQYLPADKKMFNNVRNMLNHMVRFASKR